MSASLPSNSGSRLNFRLSTRCGCRPYFCQMRWTVAGESLTSLASRRALQWVAALGLRSVALIIACSLAEVMRRGRPRTRLGPQAGKPFAAVAPPPDRHRVGPWSEADIQITEYRL
jgi:hypothetical protein